MRLRNMLKICLVFLKSEPQYAYKCYAYKNNMYAINVRYPLSLLLANSLIFPHEFPNGCKQRTSKLNVTRSAFPVSVTMVLISTNSEGVVHAYS